MGLNGLGLINQALSLVPHLFQHKPTARLMAPRVPPTQLHDDALGRAVDTLYDCGVTERYSLMAATAAQRLELAPRFAQLDRPSFHVDGRYNSAEAPEEHVMHITRGDSRDQRPDRNHVMLDVIVEHQAGIPVLMKPLSGNSRDAQDCGQLITDHLTPLQRTYGTTGLVADRALSSAENRQKLAAPRPTWITRVPATLSEAQAVFAQAAPQSLAPLTEGSRDHVVRSSDGGVEPRWVLIHSEPRQPQAQRPVDKQFLKHSEQEVNAFQPRCRTAFACEADAQQALATFAQGLQATCMAQSPIHSIPHDAKRGRPGPGTPPDQVVSQREGALAMRIAARQAVVDQHRCFRLATHELDDPLFPLQALVAGSNGQAHAERGVRFLKDPQCLASSRDLKTPERIMALLMVMTVCVLVYAALAYRIRTALKDHEGTFPDQKGQRIQNPTARWVFHDFVGIHVLFLPEPWAPLIVHLTEEHQSRLRLLGKP
jgi:transposase